MRQSAGAVCYAVITTHAYFIGEIRSQDVVTRFGIRPAAASRDLAPYKDLAPGNIYYDAKGKSYALEPDFRLIFDVPPEQVLSWLTQGFGDVRIWINPGRRSPKWITACVTAC